MCLCVQVLGTAIALQILTGVPLWAGCLITAVDTFTFLGVHLFGECSGSLDNAVRALAVAMCVLRDYLYERCDSRTDALPCTATTAHATAAACACVNCSVLSMVGLCCTAGVRKLEAFFVLLVGIMAGSFFVNFSHVSAHCGSSSSTLLRCAEYATCQNT